MKLVRWRARHGRVAGNPPCHSCNRPIHGTAKHSREVPLDQIGRTWTARTADDRLVNVCESCADRMRDGCTETNASNGNRCSFPAIRDGLCGHHLRKRAQQQREGEPTR